MPDPFALAAARRSEEKAAPAVDVTGSAYTFLPSSAGYGGGLSPSWTADLSSEAYRRNSVAFASLDRVWKGCSSVPWVEKKRAKPDDEWEQVHGGELETLVENPNPMQDRAVFMGLGVMHLFRTGNMLAQLVPETGRAREMWLLNPRNVTRIPDPARGGWTGWFEVPDRRAPNGKRRIPVERVGHVMFPDPDDPTWGWSPFEVVADIIEMDRDQVEWQRNQVNKDGSPRGYFSAPDATSPDQVKQAKARVMEVFGGKARAGEPLVVGGRTTYNHIDRTTLELDWGNTRKQTAAEIAWTLGHLPAMFSTDAMTYDNLHTAVVWAWRNINIPTLGLIEGVLNRVLIPREQRATRWITVDLSAVPALIEETAKRLAAMQTAIANAVPPNEAISMLDLPVPKQPGGDVAFIGAGLQPLTAAGLGLDADLLTGGGGEEVAPAAVPAAGGGEAQEIQTTEAAVLNGAQIQAAREIIRDAASGAIPRDSAVEQLHTWFNLDRAVAERVVASAGRGTPTTPNPNPAVAPSA
jgi:phage portal protein BeeE